MAAVAKGRCAGCGYVGSVSKVGHHVVSCAEFVRLFHLKPEQALEPAQEYARWLEAQSSAEVVAAREEAREERARGYKERGRYRVENQLSRWQAGNLPPSSPVVPPEEGRLLEGESTAHRVAREWNSDGF